jgi:hypothetical protein
MAEGSALLVDVFPHQPVRQWVLSYPFPLRFLFASLPLVRGQVLGIVYRVISMHLVNKEDYSNVKNFRLINIKTIPELVN